jgi:hypothetical protein
MYFRTSRIQLYYCQMPSREATWLLSEKYECTKGLTCLFERPSKKSYPILHKHNKHTQRDIMIINRIPYKQTEINLLSQFYANYYYY